MIAEKMKPYVKNNSAIRMMFEEGNRLRAIYGPENVFDFSLGNPIFWSMVHMYAIMTAILWKSHRILPHSSRI